jgi:hypothetical protein
MVKIGDFAATIYDGQGRLIGPGYAALSTRHFSLK